MKDDFFKYQAQTSPHPLAMEISHAEGTYIYDTNKKAYLDFVAGVSACTLGHKHPKVISAIKKQIDSYLHVMVYGEYIQKPAVELTKLLAKHLPHPLETTYLVNSGTEACMSAIRLARGFTKKDKIIKFKGCYHGHSDALLVAAGSGLATLSIPGSKGVPADAVKNTLIKKALNNVDEEAYKGLFESLRGSSAIMFSEDAKTPGVVLKEFRKESEKPLLKGAFIEEAIYLGDDQLDMLVDIKSREELIGEIIGLLQSPAKNVVSALQSSGGKLSGILKTLSQKEG